MIQAKDSALFNRQRKVKPLDANQVASEAAADKILQDRVETGRRQLAASQLSRRSVNVPPMYARDVAEELAIRYPSNDAARIGGVWVFWAGALFGISISVSGFAAAMLVWALS